MFWCCFLKTPTLTFSHRRSLKRVKFRAWDSEKKNLILNPLCCTHSQCIMGNFLESVRFSSVNWADCSQTETHWSWTKIIIVLSVIIVWWAYKKGKICFWFFLLIMTMLIFMLSNLNICWSDALIPDRTFCFCLHKYILHRWREMTGTH